MTADLEAVELARLIKRSHVGRGWCSTTPATIALYLLAHGVTLPTTHAEEATVNKKQARREAREAAAKAAAKTPRKATKSTKSTKAKADEESSGD